MTTAIITYSGAQLSWHPPLRKPSQKTVTGLGTGEAGPRDAPTPSTVVSSIFMSKQTARVQQYRVVVNGAQLGPPCEE